MDKFSLETSKCTHNNPPKLISLTNNSDASTSRSEEKTDLPPKPVVINKVTDLTDLSNVLRTLKVLLRPNAPFPDGLLSDTIVVEFTDNSKCYIPITFRTVGDVYGESLSLPLGRFPGSETINIPFKIYFTNNTKQWKHFKYIVDGLLAGYVYVSPNEKQTVDDRLELTININGVAMPPSKKGFISSQIRFFQEDPNDCNAINLLLYGYK